MTRPYTPLMRDLLAALKTAGCHPAGPITQTAAYAAGRKLLANGHQIAAALAALVVDGALTTRTDTVASVTEIKYWISSTPVPAATTEEPKMQTDSKTDSKSALLRRLISEHGPISTANLLGLANAEGGSIPRKSVASLLATAVKNGTVVKVDMGDEIQWGTPDQVAACSGLDADSAANTKRVDAPPAANAEHLAAANRALWQQLEDLQAENTRLASAATDAQAQLDAARADLRVADGHLIETAEICRALDVPDAQLAVQEIGHITAEAARHRGILKQIASQLQLNDLDALPEAIKTLGIPAVLDTTTEPQTPGRLALLLVDGTDSDLVYLEPYVIQSEGEALAIQHVDSGQADRAYLVRALYGARRKIEHGAIAVPAVETLHG